MKSASHCHSSEEPLNLTVSIPPPPQGITLNTPESDVIGTLPDADSKELFTGCRKPSKVIKFFDRTAGVVAAVQPCGIVVNISEMSTYELPTQMYTFTFGHGRDIDGLKYVVYDRSCDLHPFLCNLEHKGAYLAGFLLKHVKYLVDRFHVKGHTEPCCKLPGVDDPEKGRYHPSNKKDANTECTEQSFKWLNKYKNIVRNVKQHTFNFSFYYDRPTQYI